MTLRRLRSSFRQRREGNVSEHEGVLFYAVTYRSSKEVRKLINDLGNDVNTTDKEGKTPLFYAVQLWYNKSVVDEGTPTLSYADDHNESVVHALIEAGADVNRTDNEGKTALFYAVKKWHNESVIRALIDAGADVNRTDNDGKTALFYAFQSDSESVVRELIAAGADVNRTDNEGKTALFYAVQQRYNESVVRALIDAGADVNRTDNEGKTALFYAVQQRYNESVVGALIDAGADVNRTDNEGKTALFYAVQRWNNGSVVRALIAAGAGVNITDKEGKTALFYAFQRYNESVVRALIAAGADVNRTDNEGKTALFYAVQQRYNESVVHALIDAGADVNRTDNERKTALFYAVQQRNDGSVVHRLIAAGADVNISDNEGKTSLFYAVQQSNNESVVYALIDVGAGVNITDNEGKTALFYAAQQSNNESVVRALIDAGTDINITDKEGKTALFFVKDDHENCRVARMLIEYGGAPVDASDHYGRTPLFYALTKPHGSLMKHLLEMVTDLRLHENCNPLTFCIEKCFYNPEKHPNIGDNLKFLIKRKKLKDKTIGAMVSVIFCKAFYLKHDLADVDVDSLSELLKVAAKYVPILEVKTHNTIRKITMMIKREHHKIRLIESGCLCTTMIRRLIKLGANPNTVDSDGNTALHYAAQLALHGVPKDTVMKICHKLKECKVSFDVKNHKNETPLLVCLSRTVEKISELNDTWPGIKTQLEVCRFLLEHGSNVTVKTKSGESVLHLTIKLLKQGLRKDVFDVVKELLREFLPAFRKQDISVSIQDSRGNTPLHLWATLQLAPGQDYFTTIAQRPTLEGILQEILGLFTKHEAQLNVKNENGETPLHLCSTWKAVELLLDAGANPNDVDSSGQSPLLVAAKKAHKQGYAIFPDELPEPRIFWKTVFKNGLDPWTVDIHDESVLDMLLKSKSRDFAITLIEAACDPERQAPFSPLVLFSLLTSICKDESADAHWKKEMTERILTSTKCPVNGINNEDSPLYYCCKNIIEASKRLSDEEIKTTVHWSMVKLLRSNGADANGLTRLEEVNRCPVLKNLLLEPIGPEPRPKLIVNWKPSSKRHEPYLTEVARHNQSKYKEPYWYHHDHLASGSFGTVFAGINENDGREVAIKRVENTRLPRLKTIKREVTNLIDLAECEQIVRYLHVMEEKDFSYIVLELMEGNLDELLNKAISINEREKLCQNVLKGLKYVHGKGYLHRDLKPTNILYKNDPLRVKIADFGLSRFINGSKTTTGTFYGSNAGTRCWVAPEVIKPKSKKHSTSSDVFACGLVLHYILSVKRHPFAPKTGALESDIETNVRKGNTEGWDKSLSPEATHLIKTMLDSDDSKRPAADKALDHLFFWTQKKKVDLLIAVGNQPEFECPRVKRTLPLTEVEADLEIKFTTIIKYVDWNDPGYVYMRAIYTEMMKKRKTPYNTKSVVELVRFVRNTHAHVSENQRPTLIRKQVLEDFVFLKYFPDLVMEVYKAVTTHGWDQTREEIKYAMTQ